MKILKVLSLIISILLLTIISQIGGIVLLMSMLLVRLVGKHKKQKRIYQIGSFLILYIVATFWVIPPLAQLWGRVPLPVFSHDVIKPLNYLTPLLNRNYVSQELLQTLKEVGQQVNETYPGTNIAYLDGNFPFFDGFPLLPHLSHSDGKKLDVAFFYLHPETGKPLQVKAPSWIGYGSFEGPLNSEIDTPAMCKRKGYWQYSVLKYLVFVKRDYAFDPSRTKKLIALFASNDRVNKIFIEPHLKTRLNISSHKVRFHGCHAVRHDDHIHVEIK